jgi:hypothetical protein
LGYHRGTEDVVSALSSLLKEILGKSARSRGAASGTPELAFGKLKLRRCRHGWMLITGPYVGKCLELYGEYAESEVAVFAQYVRPGDVALDVGANIGSLTLPLAALVGQAGRVYAYESHPEVFNVLCANLALNQVRNVRPVNAFVASSPGVQTGSKYWGEHAFIGEVWQPRFEQIDALSLPACSLIKIDVDGGELEVLRSAAQTLARCRPVLYFENDVAEKSAPLLRHVLELDYRIYFHRAPIFRPDNFRGNPENAWAPRNIISKMMLAVPREREQRVEGLREVRAAHDAW